MKTLTLSLLAGGVAALFTVAPMAVANAQTDEPAAVAADHGNWTLKQREDWLHNRLEKARDDGSLDHHEYDRVKHDINDIHDDENRMRDHHDGPAYRQRDRRPGEPLDGVANKIHWLHESSFQKPW